MRENIECLQQQTEAVQTSMANFIAQQTVDIRNKIVVLDTDCKRLVQELINIAGEVAACVKDTQYIYIYNIYIYNIYIYIYNIYIYM